MKKVLSLACAAFLLLTGCASSPDSDDGTVKIVAATYPLWVFSENLLDGVDGVELSLMVDQQISCIHDYTLSVSDMLLIENADVLLLSGAGFEDFLTGVLDNYPELDRADCSAGVELIYSGGEADPHIWLDPRNASLMAGNIAESLALMLPGSARQIEKNLLSYQSGLLALYDEIQAALSELNCRDIITFHEGFAYFAAAFELDILRSIEEEAGSEASAAEIREIVELVRAYDLPAVYTEINGSTATAQAVARETGCSVGTLDMAVSGEKTADGYFAALRANAEALLEYN